MKSGNWLGSTPFVYQHRHKIARSYTIHHKALPVIPSQRKTLGQETSHRKTHPKTCSSHVESALSSGNQGFLHSSREVQKTSPGLGGHGGVLTEALEKIRTYLGNNLRQISHRCGAWPETGRKGQVWTRASWRGLGPARVGTGQKRRLGGKGMELTSGEIKEYKLTERRKAISERAGLILWTS